MTTWAEIIHDELRKCTDCGLCLSSCPTFTTGRAEGASPRGRVHLIDLVLAEGTDPVASRHLTGCLECGACHAPCPTGVRVAIARQTHRAATERLDHDAFTQRVSGLGYLIEHDPGAKLTIASVSDILANAVDRDRDSHWRQGEVLPLIGPMLRRAAPDLANRLITRLQRATYALLYDPALTTALERASGLLRDVGLVADHEQALTDIQEIVTARGYQQITVAVFDHLVLRLRNEPLPSALRVMPAHELLPVSAGSAPASAIWDHTPAPDFDAPAAMTDYTPLPEPHRASGAAVLLSETVLTTLQELIAAKRSWVGERVLVTLDSRALVRFPRARHLAEFLVPPPNQLGEP